MSNLVYILILIILLSYSFSYIRKFRKRWILYIMLYNKDTCYSSTNPPYAILTQMSKFWFDLTKDVIPNHLVSVDPADMPEYFRQPQYSGNSTMCKKLKMLPFRSCSAGDSPGCEFPGESP